ncbi:hypothetical protein LLH23_19195 [bacterium]|nr:hypothetical protein [bacterium]
MRTPLALTALLTALPLYAQTAALPPTCLWVQEGRVQCQGDVKAPPELLAAEHLGMLRALGRGLVLWTVEERDDTGNLVQFALHVANVRTGGNHRFFKDLDPFGVGTDWRLQRAELTASGRAVLLRVRLPGTGAFIAVYKLMLEPPYYWYALPEETEVWDSAAADGSAKARPYWALAADWRAAATEREGRYATVIVAGKSTPQGRKLWEARTCRDLPPYAETDITSAVVSPDGRQVAFTNPRGLWLVPVAGREPRQILPEGSAPVCVYENPVWSSDGRGLYVTVSEYGSGNTRSTSLKLVDPANPGQATLAGADARLLCIPTM